MPCAAGNTGTGCLGHFGVRDEFYSEHRFCTGTYSTDAIGVGSWRLADDVGGDSVDGTPQEVANQESSSELVPPEQSA